MTSPTKPTGTEVTMASESFRPFHTLVFNYVEAILSLPANRNHPFRGEWNALKDCNKGITAESTWHAVKNLMGITNIDDYKNMILRCPGINSYLRIQRTNQRYNSKITYYILKPVPVVAKPSETTIPAQDSVTSRASIKHLSSNPSATAIPQTIDIDHVNTPEPVPRVMPVPTATDLSHIPEGYIRVTSNWDDKSFENFFYQAFPSINAWCNANPQTLQAQLWNQAITSGLHQNTTWATVSQTLGVPHLSLFYAFLTDISTVKQQFDLQWLFPDSFSSRPEYLLTQPEQLDPTVATLDRSVTQWITRLQQKYDTAAATIDKSIATLQDKVIGSTTRLENFVNSYTTKIQNISHDIATFDNTIQHKTAYAYDKITEATNKAIFNVRNSVETIIQEYKQQFKNFTQDQINEADRIYDDLVEQAVSTIYDTTQDVLEQIAEHQEIAVTPVIPTTNPVPSAPQSHHGTTSYSSGDVRNHTAATTPRFPTPWSTRARMQPESHTMSPQVTTSAVDPVATPTPAPIAGINVISPVSPHQLDHQKFIKYVEVTYCGNIFEFYNKLQNFGIRWGVALKGIDDVTHGQSLCPEFVNGEKVSPSEYNRMAHALYEKLQSTDCIPSAYSALRNTLNRHSTTMDGFKTLYDILEDYLPSLKKEPEFPAPQSDDYANIHEYANQFEAYLTFERLSDPPRIYSERAQIRKFISGLGASYAAAVTRLEAILDTWHESSPTPWMLELHTLPKTIDKFYTGNGVIRAAKPYHKGGQESNKNKPIPEAIPAAANVCNACHIPGHPATECNAWGKTLLLSRYSRNADESIKSQAITNYLERLKKPRPKRSQMRATVRKLVAANQIDDILALIDTEASDDDNPAHNQLGQTSDEE